MRSFYGNDTLCKFREEVWCCRWPWLCVCMFVCLILIGCNDCLEKALQIRKALSSDMFRKLNEL